MGNNGDAVCRVLESIDKLDATDQAYILDIVTKRLIELRRAEIAKRAGEAERSYRTGNARSGTLEDFWKDMCIAQ
jgi:hypothetical protein